jgi:hypothetical protein
MLKHKSLEYIRRYSQDETEGGEPFTGTVGLEALKVT